MHLKELKKTPPAELVEMAEEYGIEGASTLRRQDIMFAILKEVAEDGEEIVGEGTIEVLPDGFGFLRSPQANYLAGPDDIYDSPNQVRKLATNLNGKSCCAWTSGMCSVPCSRKERYCGSSILISSRCLGIGPK